MFNKEKLATRFQELEDEYNNLKRINSSNNDSYYVEGSQWRKWATSAQSIILAVFRENSPHYKNFTSSYEKCTGRDTGLSSLSGIFLSAKADFDGGYVFNIETEISGEIFGDFVAMAKAAISEGHKDVAAVLACAALEDALKRFARLNDLEVDDEVMQKVVAALKSKGLVTGAQKSLLDVMPKIRDYAMHANWDKITPEDANSVIGFVEQFLLTKF